MWEGSKFWKQFFEASANVSLTGYEEVAAEDEDGTYTEHITTAGSSAMGSRTVTPVEGSEGVGGEDGDGDHEIDESLLTSPSVAHATSTPRLPTTASRSKGKTTKQPQFADYPSPYESLKREWQASSSPTAPPPEPTIAIDNPITPGKTSALPDMSMTPESSPFAIPPATTEQQKGGRVNHDPLLHRILDKNYRIAATPHTQRKQAQANRSRSAATPGTSTRTGGATTTMTTRFLDNDDLGSSPDVPAPQLREDLFSPAKVRAATTQRTPGVSVQTPGAKRQIRKSLEARGRTPAKDGTQQTRDIFGHGGGNDKVSQFTAAATTTGGQTRNNLWDSDEDEDGLDGFSPPKTMQFHIPQSRILQTPAREASKRIVEDLLLTAGGDITDDFDETIDRAPVDDSPSVVRRDENLDDSF